MTPARRRKSIALIPDEEVSPELPDTLTNDDESEPILVSSKKNRSSSQAFVEREKEALRRRYGTEPEAVVFDPSSGQIS